MVLISSFEFHFLSIFEHVPSRVSCLCGRQKRGLWLWSGRAILHLPKIEDKYSWVSPCCVRIMCSNIFGVQFRTQNVFSRKVLCPASIGGHLLRRASGATKSPIKPQPTINRCGNVPLGVDRGSFCGSRSNFHSIICVFVRRILLGSTPLEKRLLSRLQCKNISWSYDRDGTQIIVQSFCL